MKDRLKYQSTPRLSSSWRWWARHQTHLTRIHSFSERLGWQLQNLSLIKDVFYKNIWKWTSWSTPCLNLRSQAELKKATSKPRTPGRNTLRRSDFSRDKAQSPVRRLKFSPPLFQRNRTLSRKTLTRNRRTSTVEATLNHHLSHKCRRSKMRKINLRTHLTFRPTQLWSPCCCSSSPSVAWSSIWETSKNKTKSSSLNRSFRNLFWAISHLQKPMLLLDKNLRPTEIQLEITKRWLQNMNGPNSMLKKWTIIKSNLYTIIKYNDGESMVRNA